MAKPKNFELNDLKTTIDKRITYWREQLKLHISKRDNCIGSERIFGHIDELQFIRKTVFGSEKK